MKTYHIIKAPNEILRTKAKPAIITKETSNIIEQMKTLMQRYYGCGLAAPQIGLDQRIIVVSLNDRTIAMINPIILEKSQVTRSDIEGCLSVPGIHKRIERPAGIIVAYTTMDNKKRRGIFLNQDARIIQHEIDHLEGITIQDK